jgi:uncharacterized cupredoxin-like copper-binding protein
MTVLGLSRATAPRLGVLMLCAAIAGCGKSNAATAKAGPVVPVTERDFHIQAPTHLAAGPVTLRVSNEGPDQHELIVVRTPSGTLPIRPDGFTVAEESVEESEPGALEPGEPGAVRDLHLNLTPGRYVFFCNMEGHFMGGMHHEVVVG